MLGRVQGDETGKTWKLYPWIKTICGKRQAQACDGTQNSKTLMKLLPTSPGSDSAAWDKLFLGMPKTPCFLVLWLHVDQFVVPGSSLTLLDAYFASFDLPSINKQLEIIHLAS